LYRLVFPTSHGSRQGPVVLTSSRNTTGTCRIQRKSTLRPQAHLLSLARPAVKSVQPSTPSEGAGLRWRVVVASILVITVAMLPGFLPGALAVQLADSLGIAEEGVGFVVGAFFGMSALVSPRLGRVVERLGWAPAMRIAALGAGMTLLLTPLVAHSVLTLGVATIAGGAALALAHPAVNLGLARCTVVRRQGLAYGFKHAAIPAASALAGLGLPLVAIPLGWQWVYFLGAVLAGGAALMVPFSPRKLEIRDNDVAEADATNARSSPLSFLVIMAIAAGLGIFGMDALATFLVPYAVDVGFGEAAAGVLLAVGSGLGILVRVASGWLIDRRATGGLATVVVFLGLGAVGIAVLAVGTNPAIVGGSLLAFTFGWGWSGLFTFAVVRRNPQAPAAATGVTMTGVYVGAAAGPALFGVVAGASFTLAWLIMSAALASGAILMTIALVSDRTEPA
jgi:predicted MFS family arabinose efflux permease